MSHRGLIISDKFSHPGSRFSSLLLSPLKHQLMHRISLSRFSWIFFVLLANVLVISSGFGLASDPPAKTFRVTKVGKPIPAEKKAQLLKFYKAIYGQKAKPSKIEIIKGKRHTWLAFQLGGQASPTMAVELKIEDGFYTFGPSSAKNTCSGNPCSYCQWRSDNCYCDGEGDECNHIRSGIKGVGDGPLQTLGIGG